MMTTAAISPARYSVHRGFTVVELIVACVVTSVVLGGVYSTFHHCLRAEGLSAVRMKEAAEVEAVISEFARTLANAAILSGSGPIRGSTASEGTGSLTCRASLVGRSAGRPGLLVQRVLYRWARQEAGKAIVLTVQELPFAGTRCVHPLRVGEQPLRELWEKVPPVTVAGGIDEMSIRYRAADDPTGQWQDGWERQEVPAVWINVRIGETTRDAVIVPKVRERLLG